MADRSVVYRLIADVSAFKAQMATAAASVKGTADKMTAATAEGAKFRQGLTTVGNVAGGIGLVAAAGLGIAIAKAANFDQAMSSVGAATHETAGNMELLRAAALKAGADTAFSATEAAAGIEALAKAGVSTKDVLAGGLKGALDLAAAGSLEVGDAAEIAATAMTQFNLKGADIPHVADLLAAAAGKAQGEVSDMGAALKQSGLVAAQMGISIEDTTGTLAAFAKAGLIGSDAGTSFKTMLQRLSNPSAESARAMATLGIAAYDAQGNFVGLTDIAGQLRGALQNKTQAERDSALATIFGSDAVRAASVLYQQGESGIQGWINKTNDSGFAAETAATKLDNLRGDLEAFGGSLETALIGTGEGSQGVLRNMVQGLTNVVNAFNNLPPAAHQATSSMLAITAITGGGLWFGSKVVNGIARTRASLGDLGATAVQTRGALAGVGRGLAIGALIVGLSALDQYLQKLTHVNLEAEGLGRSLTALGERAVSAGTISQTFGKDLEGFGKQAQTATSNIGALNSKIFAVIPGESSYDIARRNIEELDGALASMVEGGSADTARLAFQQLAAAAEKQGVSIGDLRDLFPEYKTALGNVGSEAQGAASGTNNLTSATSKGAGATTSATAAAKRMAAALAEQRKAARETTNSFLDFGDSLTNAKMNLGEWLTNMAQSGQALRHFTNNATIAANRGLNKGLIASLRDAGVEGALRMHQLANATDSQLARANRAWVRNQRTGRAATAALSDGADSAKARIHLMRQEIESTKSKIVHMDEKGAAAARERIGRLRAAIAALRDRSVNITTHYRTTGHPPPGSHPATGNVVTAGAEGMTVPGSRHPYRDKVLAYLAPGEEVISNRFGQADRHRDLLRAINAGRYANGGTVNRISVPAANVNMAGALAGAQIRAVFPGIGEMFGTIVDERMDKVAAQAARRSR